MLNNMISIDRLDARILELLIENARVGVADMAETLGISRNTVQSRINRLEESGVLLGFRPIIEFARIGMPVQAILSVEVDQKKLSIVVAGLSNLAEVLEVKIQAGREDILVEVALASLQALQDLTVSIVDIDGVRKTTTTFPVSTPVPYRVLPLLQQLTEGTGWGRSTPDPHLR